jgi:hypothetical protein
MNKRILLEKRDGYIQFSGVTENGRTYYGTCIDSQWEAYLLKKKLVDSGVDEKLVDDLYQMGYEEGFDAGQDNILSNY